MQLDNKKELMEKWLSLFWKSQLFFLPDIRNAKWLDWWSIHTNDIYISTNDDMPYWLFFTPSGNYWKVNRVWEKLIRNTSTAEPYIPALYFDLDLKGTDNTEINTVDDLFDKTVEIIKERKLPVSFLTKSWWWVHWYIMIEENSRIMVWQLKKLTPMLEKIADMFPWWDHNRLSIEKLMRMPFSNHWKTWEAKQVELYRLYREATPEWMEIECVKVTSPDMMDLWDFDYMPYESIRQFAQSIVESIDSRKNLWITMDVNVSNDITVINKIPIRHIFDRLWKYPRESMMIWEWQPVKTLTVFTYNKTHIGFQHTNTVSWEVRIETTMGYRINEAENYVHNFTFDNHDITERPRGEVYSFLYHYFYKDRVKIAAFLKDEFHIQLDTETHEHLMPSIVSSSGTINFTKKKVIYRKEKPDKKWHLIMTEQLLFDIPLSVKWVIDSTFSMRWELSTPVKYYIINLPESFTEKEIIIEFKESRAKFNATYGKYWLIFKWSEEDLLDFFFAINNAVNAWQVDTYSLAYLNWYHNDYFLLWNTFITPEFVMRKEWKNTMVQTSKVELALEWKQFISVSEYGNMMCRLYSERISMTSITAYIALFLGTSYWKIIETYKQQAMLPWLMFSWKTMAGKSTLINILKEWSWISWKAVLRSVKSTTPQPLKQAACDSFILHLEEFTWTNIWHEKESIMRDIINKTVSSRGTLSGENITFNFRASLVLDWERLPSSKSVLNRCIIIPMFEDDKRWDEKLLSEIREYSFMQDLITRAYLYNDNQRLELFKQCEEKLKKNFSWRQLMLYTYLLAINRMYKIFHEDVFIEALASNRDVLSSIQNESNELSELLSDLLITRRIVWRKVFDMHWNISRLEIALPPEVVNEKQIDIVSATKKYYPKIDFRFNKLTIIDYESNDDLVSILSPFLHYFRY